MILVPNIWKYLMQNETLSQKITQKIKQLQLLEAAHLQQSR
jgi:hypothetical protein